MDYNAANVEAVFTGLSTAFNERLAATTSYYGKVAMTVPSTTSSNTYPRMDDLPGFREWIGDRVVHNLSAQSYSIRNREFEKTIGIKRSQIEDDELGMLAVSAAQFGQDAAEFPDQLVFPLLGQGHMTKCYDGQYFFDGDHPGYDENGKETSVSNVANGAGPAWYLIDDTKVMKPMVFQSRKLFTGTAMTDPRDSNVFHKGQFEWGVDGRCNAGFGLWQLAFRSTKPLTPDNYEEARKALTNIRKRDGQVINIMPNSLLVPSALEADGRKLLNADLINGGDTNIWRGTAELSVIPLLS